MHQRNRRQFLADVGRGMLVAGVGTALATDLGLAPAFADDGTDRLTFGSLEPLVSLMQETPPDRLLPILAGKIREGADLRTLTAAAGLATGIHDTARQTGIAVGIAALGTLISSTDYVGSLQTVFMVGGMIGAVGALAALFLFRGPRGSVTAAAPEPAAA